MTVEMEIINEDGVLIKKDIPINLVPDYQTIGWKLIEKKRKPVFVKEEKKEDK